MISVSWQSKLLENVNIIRNTAAWQLSWQSQLHENVNIISISSGVRQLHDNLSNMTEDCSFTSIRYLLIFVSPELSFSFESTQGRQQQLLDSIFSKKRNKLKVEWSGICQIGFSNSYNMHSRRNIRFWYRDWIYCNF